MGLFPETGIWKRWALFLAGAAVFMPVAVQAGTGGRIDWETDLALARERAEIRERPLMLYFYGET
jgi:hypothetical protein